MCTIKRILFGLLLLMGSQAYAASFFLSPMSQNVGIGDTVQIDMGIDGDDLFDWNNAVIQLNWDTTKLTFSHVGLIPQPDLTVLLDTSGAGIGGILGVTVDSSTGNPLPKANSYTFGSLFFEAVASGVGIVDLLSGTTSGGIALEWDSINPAQVNVAPVPLPAAAWLFIGGLGMLVSARRRRQS